MPSIHWQLTNSLSFLPFHNFCPRSNNNQVCIKLPFGLVVFNWWWLLVGGVANWGFTGRAITEYEASAINFDTVCRDWMSGIYNYHHYREAVLISAKLRFQKSPWILIWRCCWQIYEGQRRASLWPTYFVDTIVLHWCLFFLSFCPSLVTWAT